ncbi:MAG: hypothetical protein IPM57_10930, partial [Oligoflexia bacterium]|nr:hypothetical protein [Oligoflexia bacterium]
MKKLICLFYPFVFTSQNTFAHKYSQKLKQATEIGFERVVLESSFNEDIKAKPLKGLIYELADWYKVNLIKREALPKELRQKFKKYQAHLALLQFNGNQVVKNQILEEYRSLEGMNDLSLDEVEQILLARIFKKHINVLESQDSTDAQKSASAAIALRMLTEAYIAAATHKVKVQESKEQIEKTQDVRAIKRMVFVGSFVSLAGFAQFDNSGLLAQTSI